MSQAEMHQVLTNIVYFVCVGGADRGTDTVDQPSFVTHKVRMCHAPDHMTAP